MKIRLDNVLLVYKHSAYSVYFMERKVKLAKKAKINLTKEMGRFKKAHDEHHASLKEIERILRKYKIDYDKSSRGQKTRFGRYDLVITVGGDGTFLETSRNIRDQVLFGINSAPSFSVGKLCAGTSRDFEKILKGIIGGKIKAVEWPRIRLDMEGPVRRIDCVNDILIAHKNPAAMSRYYLKIGKVKEEQRDSGLWIATAAGSTGAIRSAGGRPVDPRAKKFQYMPRELHYGFKPKYRLKGGVLPAKKKLTVVSLMRQGTIFIDGTHYQMKFPFHSALEVSLSPLSLKTVTLKK